MFPNPQDALPLPPRPNLEQYKKLAKDLVKACRDEAAARVHKNDTTTSKQLIPRQGAIGDWVLNWLERLARLQGLTITQEVRDRIDRRATPIEEFIRTKLSSKDKPAADLDGSEIDKSTSGNCSLTNAQFVIARAHGFLSWPKLTRHITEVTRANSPVSNFETAADAIIAGDVDTLERLLREDPELIRARSTREHNATLLHYIAANGVENYRQKTPKNAPQVADILLKAGAEVDATAAVYRGACTTLELVATSAHPKQAGVQNALIEKLLQHGAAVDGAPGGPGMITHCVNNGCPEAAELLASHGARMGLQGAAALGRLDLVQNFFDNDGNLKTTATRDELASGFLVACGYGHNDVVDFLLQRGVDIATHESDGQTGLHWAAIGGQLETVKLLLHRKAPLEIHNMFGGTVLGQTMWSAAHGGDPETYSQIIEALIDAGAEVYDRHPPINKRIDELLLKYGSRPDETLWWYGEKPKRRNVT
ncbi:MAG TPA: ankyrin repeat domain-containing protein [Pyrinomonadaceae bacterium]|nr:ankyrin repeat domain-containing protein [Pyrinomonadaceae bacterium]